MIQEDKEILLIDLCARLPYGTKVRAFIGEKSENDEILGCVHIFNFYAHDCKPYLRPMSSMTEGEKEEFHKLKQFSVTVVMPNGVSLLKPTYIVDLEENGNGLNHLYDWLNAHHFDYRDLIKKGLAIEAPEGMY